MLREDGSECAPDEPGELVHRGALVGLGYWNDAEKTAYEMNLRAAKEIGVDVIVTIRTGDERS